ncbi:MULTISPECIES: isochorismatase family protein [unclassified Modestobacter]
MTDFAADAAAAGLAGRLGPGTNPALLLVDPARAYTEPTSPLYAGVEGAVAAMRRLLGACRAAGIPIVITRVWHEFPGDGGLFARKVPASVCFAAGSPLAEPIDGLEHRPGEVLLTKQYPSAFFGTALAATLTAQGVDTLVVAGLSTSGCVRATALDALQHGFVPLVVREAVGDRLPEVHQANLRDIDAKVGDVVSLADVETQLTTIPRRTA